MFVIKAFRGLNDICFQGVEKASLFLHGCSFVHKVKLGKNGVHSWNSMLACLIGWLLFVCWFHGHPFAEESAIHGMCTAKYTPLDHHFCCCYSHSYCCCKHFNYYKFCSSCSQFSYSCCHYFPSCSSAHINQAPAAATLLLSPCTNFCWYYYDSCNKSSLLLLMLLLLNFVVTASIITSMSSIDTLSTTAAVATIWFMISVSLSQLSYETFLILQQLSQTIHCFLQSIYTANSFKLKFSSSNNH